MGNFDFYLIIKNYAETTGLIDKKVLSKEDSYKAQQSSKRV